jgi:hypothetical protein
MAQKNLPKYDPIDYALSLAGLLATLFFWGQGRPCPSPLTTPHGAALGTLLREARWHRLAA